MLLSTYNARMRQKILNTHLASRPEPDIHCVGGRFSVSTMAHLYQPWQLYHPDQLVETPKTNRGRIWGWVSDATTIYFAQLTLPPFLPSCQMPASEPFILDHTCCLLHRRQYKRSLASVNTVGTPSQLQTVVIYWFWCCQLSVD